MCLVTLVQFLDLSNFFDLPIRILLEHDVSNVIVKMENKVWITRVEVVVPFKIFSKAINFQRLGISKATAN